MLKSGLACSWQPSWDGSLRKQQQAHCKRRTPVPCFPRVHLQSIPSGSTREVLLRCNHCQDCFKLNYRFPRAPLSCFWVWWQMHPVPEAMTPDSLGSLCFWDLSSGDRQALEGNVHSGRAWRPGGQRWGAGNRGWPGYDQDHSESGRSHTWQGSGLLPGWC